MQLTEQVANGARLADADLIERARAGDTDAFGALVAARLERTLRMARAILGSEPDALDAVQEAFLAAWVHLSTLRDPSRFDAWLNQTLANRCRDVLRRRGRVREIAIDDLHLSRPDPASASIDRAALLAAFDRLSVPSRQLLVFRHLEDLTNEEIGVRLGIPPGTVKSRLFAARRALERALETQR